MDPYQGMDPVRAKVLHRCTIRMDLRDYLLHNKLLIVGHPFLAAGFTA
jgi:hypothetical protein